MLSVMRGGRRPSKFFSSVRARAARAQSSSVRPSPSSVPALRWLILTLKLPPEFQLLHAPTAFHAERIAWRFVIYLNLARSIRRTLDAISPDHETLNSHTFDDDDDKNAEAASVIIPSTDGTPSCYHKINRYEGYYSRLAPLLFLEQRLIALLSDKEDDEEWEATRLTNTWSHSPSLLSGSVHGSKTPPDSNGRLAVTIPQTVIHPSLNSLPSPQPTPELSVKTTSNWKKALSSGGRMKNPKSPHSGELEGWWEDPDDPVHILNECAPAMLDLWEDPNVKQRLTEKRLRLEESSGLCVPHYPLSASLLTYLTNSYLDEIPRITAKKYIPTDGSSNGPPFLLLLTYDNSRRFEGQAEDHRRLRAYTYNQNHHRT